MRIHYFHRRDANKHILPVTERISRWIQQCYIKVTVATLGAPTPVYVHETMLVITVNDKGMTACRCIQPCIIYRTAGIQLLIYYVHPLRRGIIVTKEEIDTCIITELIDQATASLIGISSGA